MPSYILIGIVALVVLFIIVVAMQPAQFTVTRPAKMAAPPDKIFPHVNELRKWEAWSPWAKLNPTAKNSFEGQVSGVGAASRWNGTHRGGRL